MPDMDLPQQRVHIDGLTQGEVALLRDVAEAAADKAVTKAFLVVGLDLDDPLVAQGEFAMLRQIVRTAQDDEFRSDLNWLRRTRLRSEGAVGKIMVTAIGLAVVGAAHALWTGLLALVKLKT